jgi:signal transduction histidine kinase
MRRRPPGRTPPPRQDQVEELLATVAHELRRPLTALLGALATVQQRGPALSAAQQQELLAMARRQGTQLLRLLEQLLVAGVPDAQAAVARAWLIDAATLATEAGVAAQLAYPHHRITIDAAGPLPVRADPLAITRILGNLLDNAAAHAPAGSPIRLRGGRDGTEVVLAVQDGGPGIPPEARDRIFERYVQLDRDGRPASGGLGLGLCIARRLAHANDGELRCTDPPGGRGACFELRLPIARPALDLHPQAPPSGAGGEER